jgi:hypothetical protein
MLLTTMLPKECLELWQCKSLRPSLRKYAVTARRGGVAVPLT